jgi:N-acetylglucosamine kinase-like BadF-type ATPase
VSRTTGSGRELVLGIDGGNSKVDIALARADGTLLGARRGPTISHQQRELAEGMEHLRQLVWEIAKDAGLGVDAGAGAGVRGSRESGARESGAGVSGTLTSGTGASGARASGVRGSGAPMVGRCVATLAGADYPADIRLLTRSISGLGLAEHVTVVNDTIGALRAGASRPWGVGLVCGQGINASAIAPNGRQVGFPAVGEIAGDWGGATSIGMAALGAAVRAQDGRGPHTAFERSVPAFFGLRRPADVTRALYEGRFGPETPVSGRLAPLVFQEAAAGDTVARQIVERLATELATMANALIRRLHMTRLDVEVVLAGGVFRTDEAGFYASLERQVCAVAPDARFVRLRWPPVAGAVLLAIEEATDSPADEKLANQLRHALGSWDRSVIEASRASS